MIKKIDILGMHVDNYTVRESLLQMDTYMSSAALNIVKTVTMEQLALAGENPKVRECIEQADLSVIGDREILAETENATVQRLKEVRDNDFLFELLRRVVRGQKRVFLIAMTWPEVEGMEDFFTEADSKFAVAGSYAAEDCAGDEAAIVNEMNAATPDIIISSLPSPYEEEFLCDHKEKINASVWYGAGIGYRKSGGFRAAGDMLRRLLLRGRLHRAMARYQSEGKEKKK